MEIRMPMSLARRLKGIGHDIELTAFWTGL